jgi:hypothetical protein
MSEEIFSIIDDNEEFFKNIPSSVERMFKEARKDLSLTRFNLQEKSMLISSLRMKWVMIFLKEKKKLDDLKDYRKNYVKIKVDELSKAEPSTPRIQLEHRITGVESRAELQKLDRIIDETKEMVEFLQNTVQIFNDFGFAVKNAVDTIKLAEA